jgi:pimeloyl-ACP methyl ester carboxylesterase
MLHGTGGSWENWCANIRPFSKYFNCVAIDMVGSGLTEKPDFDYELPIYMAQLRGLMLSLGLKTASIIGLSMGGWIGSAFAIRHTELVDKLILLSSSGMIVDEANSARIQNSRAGAVDQPTFESVASVFRTLIHDENKRMEDLVALRLNIYSQPEMKLGMKHIVAMQGGEIRDRNLLHEKDWRSIKAPTLIIASLADRDVYLRTAEKIKEYVPNSRLVKLDGVGHWIQFEAQEIFNEMAIEFLLSA